MNWTIGKKLGAAFAVLIVIMIGSSSLAYYNMQKMDKNVDYMMLKELELKEISEIELLVSEQLALEKKYLLSGEESFIREHEEYGEEGREVLKLLEEQLRRDGDLRALAEVIKIEEAYEKYEDTFTRVEELYHEGHIAEAIALSRDESDREAEELGEALAIVFEMEEVKMDSLRKEVDDSFQTAVIELIIAGIVGVLLAVILGVFITRNITGGLKKAVEFSESIADGDLSVSDLAVTSQDEVGILTGALNTMKNKLVDLITQFKLTAEQVASAATEIASAAEQSASGAGEQEAQAGEVSSSIEQMSATIVESSQNAASATESARNAAEAAGEGGHIVQQTIEGMQAIAEAVKASATTIAELGKRSDEIGEIIGVIDDIADQTNLLALNAAIEAARAGEQGRGFAVVADEVRKLAERTTKATAEIAGMIKGIQEDTSGAVTSMEEGTTQVEAGMELAVKAGDSLTSIVSVVSEVQKMIEQIATASDEQSAAAEQISGNVGNIATVSKQSAQSAEQMAATAEELNRQTDALNELVARFKLDDSESSVRHDQVTEAAKE